MRKIMAIFAHPDDEGAISGTLAKYAAAGHEITLICGTRGEVGEISDPALATPETLGEVRQKELESACAVLGIQNLAWLNYRDSGMQGTPQNEDPRALIQADESEAKTKIASLVRKYQPELILTFEPFGWYGHPDHIMVSKWVTEMFPKLGDPEAFTTAEPAWQPKALYHSVISFSKYRDAIQQMVESGLIDPPDLSDGIPEEQQLRKERETTHVIQVTDFFDQRRAATRSHRTQFADDHMFNKIPHEIEESLWGTESFIQVFPAPDPEQKNNPADAF